MSTDNNAQSRESRDDGGPAFPFDNYDGHHTRATCRGMSLMDYLAAQALSAAVKVQEIASTHGMSLDVSPEIVAENAYRIAKACLAERAKQ